MSSVPKDDFRSTLVQPGLPCFLLKNKWHFQVIPELSLQSFYRTLLGNMTMEIYQTLLTLTLDDPLSQKLSLILEPIMNGVKIHQLCIFLIQRSHLASWSSKGKKISACLHKKQVWQTSVPLDSVTPTVEPVPGAQCVKHKLSLLLTCAKTCLYWIWVELLNHRVYMFFNFL